jgi:predicted nucleic acid-binding protein
VILIDTSIWIEVFRRPSKFRIEEHLSLDEVVTCLPVIQEVLQGFLDERAYRRAYEAMFAFPVLEMPLSRVVFEDAVRLYRSARRSGLKIRSSLDCLIAACAVRADVELVHRDRDFSALARVSTLRERSL